MVIDVGVATEVGAAVNVGVATEVGGVRDVIGAVETGVPAPPTERLVREVGGGAMGVATTGEPPVPPDGRGVANFLGRDEGGGGGRCVFTVVTTSSGFCREKDEKVNVYNRGYRIIHNGHLGDITL